jgi:hypothetical protein
LAFTSRSPLDVVRSELPEADGEGESREVHPPAANRSFTGPTFNGAWRLFVDIKNGVRGVERGISAREILLDGTSAPPALRKLKMTGHTEPSCPGPPFSLGPGVDQTIETS